jgi:PDZ domain-containing secreted protein
MKQKLKEKFNFGDKVKKNNNNSFTKCLKMSKELENLKNGDSSVINNSSNNHNHVQTQQQHPQNNIKLNNNNNSNADSTKSIVGGRLQFYKGKYQL